MNGSVEPWRFSCLSAAAVHEGSEERQRGSLGLEESGWLVSGCCRLSYSVWLPYQDSEG